MKKIILVLALSLSLFAIDSKDLGNAGFNDLTTQEQAEILKTVADKKSAQTAIPEIKAVATAKVAQEWVDLGSSIGKGLASSAKELGIAVNDFSKSGVGQLTMFLIVYKIIGTTIIHVVGGLIFIILGVSYTTVLLNRFSSWKEVHKDGKLVSRERVKTDGESVFGFWISYMIIILIGTFIIVL